MSPTILAQLLLCFGQVRATDNACKHAVAQVLQKLDDVWFRGLR
jgi:hypothetical protein